MKKIITAGCIALFISLMSSCANSSKKEREGTLTDKKVQLEQLRKQRDDMDAKITALQNEISKLDTSSANNLAPKLVALTSVKKEDFNHYLDLQGSVDAKNISYITPSGQPGQIKAIYVKQGDVVRKGQLILRLDNSVALQNVAAIKQQKGSIQAQLELAKSVYDRQKNLWQQHIGTEVQLLQSKTNVETLENQLKAIQAQVNAAQEQANQSNVYSNVNGTVDDITAHVGETFNGNPLTGGYIKIVNKSDLKITVNVPENYAGKIHKGTKVIVEIPDLNRTFNSKITFISQAIGTTTRGFIAEIEVPSGLALRPNQIAQVKILDYSAPDAISVPLNTLQTDEKGKYVLVASKEGDQLIARKKNVIIGELYGDSIEIKQGLSVGDQIITDGFQGLFDGQPITTHQD